MHWLLMLVCPLSVVHPVVIFWKSRNTFCLTRSLSNATFSFLITWRSSSSKSAAVYKISLKAYDFSLRYGDITIFKMAAVSQISCQSDTQIWRYSYLNFSHIWLEMPIQAPKMEVLGNFGPLNVIIHHWDPQKAHPCVNPRLVSYQL